MNKLLFFSCALLLACSGPSTNGDAGAPDAAQSTDATIDAHDAATPQDAAADVAAESAAAPPTCHDFCTKAQGASCAQTESDCESQCDSELASTKAHCATVGQSLVNCGVEHGTFQGCSSSGLPTLSGCDCQALTYVNYCAPTAPDQGAYVFNGLASNDACDLCALTSCCDSVMFCLNDTSEQCNYGDYKCYLSCHGDPNCFAGCSLSGLTISQFDPATCLETNCKTACGLN